MGGPMRSFKRHQQSNHHRKGSNNNQWTIWVVLSVNMAWINTMMQSQPIHKPISKPMKQRELTDVMARKGQQTMMLTCTNQRQLRQLN